MYHIKNCIRRRLLKLRGVPPAQARIGNSQIITLFVNKAQQVLQCTVSRYTVLVSISKVITEKDVVLALHVRVMTVELPCSCVMISQSLVALERRSSAMRERK